MPDECLTYQFYLYAPLASLAARFARWFVRYAHQVSLRSTWMLALLALASLARITIADKHEAAYQLC
jgi:hypothetical protein